MAAFFKHPATTWYLFYIGFPYGTCITIFQTATDKTVATCYNLRKRGILFMANKTKTIQVLNLADNFLFGKMMSDVGNLKHGCEHGGI